MWEFERSTVDQLGGNMTRSGGGGASSQRERAAIGVVSAGRRSRRVPKITRFDRSTVKRKHAKLPLFDPVHRRAPAPLGQRRVRRATPKIARSNYLARPIHI